MKFDTKEPSKRTFAKEKQQSMDRLAKESTEAIEKGISYGKLKAMQREAGYSPLPKEPPKGDYNDPEGKVDRVCIVCGRAFKAKTTARKYCSKYCCDKMTLKRQQQKRLEGKE